MGFYWTEPKEEQGFYWFPKQFIEEGIWACLPSASKSVLPVLCAHVNSNSGIAFPGERRIAAMSGRTDKTVREGIKGLIGVPGFETSRQREAGRWQHRTYKIELPKKPNVRSAFLWKRIVFTGGNWSRLTPAAQAVYPVLRWLSRWDFDLAYWLDKYFQDQVGETRDMREALAIRTCDFLEIERLSPTEIANFAGISRRHVWKAIESLEENFLIEWKEEPEMTSFRGYMAYLIPPKRWVPKALNADMRQRYRYEIETGSHDTREIITASDGK